MSAATRAPDLPWRAALTAVTERAERCDRTLVACGRLAVRLAGLSCQVEAIDVIADGPPAGHLDAAELRGGGWTWAEAGLPVNWIQRTDLYRPLYEAAAAAACDVPDSPLPVAPMAYVAAMLLASRETADAAVIAGLMVAGQLDPGAVRHTVQQWLGVYALEDLEAIIQEAEWRLMRLRYERGDDPH